MFQGESVFCVHPLITTHICELIITTVTNMFAFCINIFTMKIQKTINGVNTGTTTGEHNRHKDKG